MLISHRKKFIFTKTVKTAGTSIEGYFEPYCLPEGEWEAMHSRPEYEGSTGIIGYRGRLAKHHASKWYNHMAAELIRDRAGHEIWESYLKFTVIRNPFDKLISGFSMFERNKSDYSLTQKLKAFNRRMRGKGKAIDRISGKTPVERFRSWIQLGGTISDQNKYKINGKNCVDYFIRFEHMQEDLKTLCKRLEIPFEPEKLPNFKAGIRTKDTPIRDYYDEETEAIVRKTFDWEIEHFNYQIPE
jgi:hypothetical protein